MKELVKKYEEMLKEMSIVPVRVDPALYIESLTERQVLNHCLWMCEQIEKMLEAEPERAAQWVGFVQGCLFMTGRYNIDALRKHDGKMSIP